MAYQRGSEELYRSQPNFRSRDENYNPETLELMRQATTRNIDQRREIGDIGASGVRETGQIAAKALGDLPGQYMKGAEFKQAGEKHQQGSEEHQAYMGNAAQSRDMNAQNMQRNQALMAEEARQVGRKQRIVGGQSYEDASDAQAMENAKLGNDSSRAQIAASNMQIESLKSAKERQGIDDQAAINAAWMKEHPQDPGMPGMPPPPPPKAGTPEGNAYAANAKAKGSIQGAADAKNVVYASSPSGAPIAAKLTNVISPKMEALSELVDAQALYDNTSGIPGKDIANKNAAMTKANLALEKLELEPISDYGGDMTPTFKSTQFKEAIKRASGDLKVSLTSLKSNKGSGSQEIDRLINEHEARLAKLSRGMSLTDKVRDQMGLRNQNAPVNTGGVQKVSGTRSTPDPLFEGR